MQQMPADSAPAAAVLRRRQTLVQLQDLGDFFARAGKGK